MAENKRSKGGRRGKGKGKGKGKGGSASRSAAASRPPASAEDLDGAPVPVAADEMRVPKKRRTSGGSSRVSSPVPPSSSSLSSAPVSASAVGAKAGPPAGAQRKRADDAGNNAGEERQSKPPPAPAEEEPEPEEAKKLVLTSSARRGVYECDYCRADVTQVPRVQCAVCPDFDVCLDCLATTDPSAAGTIRAAAAATARLAARAAAAASSSAGGDSGGDNKKTGEEGVKKEATADDSKTKGVSKGRSSVAGLSSAALNHDHTHGYRVADSTRFPVFPTVRGVTVIAAAAAEEKKVASVDGEAKEKESNDSAVKSVTDEAEKKKADESKKEGRHDAEGKSDDVEMTDTEKEKGGDGGKKDGVDDEDAKAEPMDVDKADDASKASKKDEGDEKKKGDKGVSEKKDKEESLIAAAKKDEKEDEKSAGVKGAETAKKAARGSGDKKKVKDEMDVDETETGTKPDNTEEEVGGAPVEGDDAAAAEQKKQQQQLLWSDDPKAVWTAEEDLRLLDAISRYGLGNWADVSDVVNGAADGASGGGGKEGATSGTGGTPIPGTSQKSARRCMERYCDDWLGRYGEILPQYTLVEEPDEEGEGNGAVAGANAEGEENKDGKPSSAAAAASAAIKEEDADLSDAAASARKRKRKVGSMSSFSETTTSGRRSPMPLSRQCSSVVSSSGGGKANDGFRSKKKYVAVETSTLPGHSDTWPFPYLPPLEGVQIGDEVNRDRTSRAESDFLRASNQSGGSKADFDCLRAEWQSKRLSEYVDGGVLPRAVLPPRLEDVRSLPGGELAGYMPRRGDFDVEWDNDAERSLAEMEFAPQDTAAERQLKIRIVESYNTKLDERERRKKFLLERNLIDYRENQRKDMLLPPDERDLVNRMRLFARFHSPEEHEAFVSDLLKAKRLRKEIAKLQSYRRMGIRSLAEAERYELDKARREQHRYAVKQKEAEERKAGIAPSGGSAAKADSRGGGGADSPALWRRYKSNDRSGRGGGSSDPKAGGGAEETKKGGGDKDSTVAARDEEKKDDDDDFDLSSMPGRELLSSREAALCRRLRLRPRAYLDAKRALISESLQAGMLDQQGGGGSNSTVLKIDVEKRGDVIDFVARSGWIPARPTMASRTSSSSEMEGKTKDDTASSKAAASGAAAAVSS